MEDESSLFGPPAAAAAAADPLATAIHLVVVFLEMRAALLNMAVTWMSKSEGMAIPLARATSDSVRMQFSTLTRWSTDSQEHWETRKAAPSSWTKMGWRVWIYALKRLEIMMYDYYRL